MKKPKFLDEWDKSCDDFRKTLPRCCFTCAHHVESADEIFCRKFQEVAPLDFANTRDSCAEWSSVLDDLPF